MFHIVIILIAVIHKVFAGNISPPSSVSEPLVSDLLISSFLDDNGYIRLNISWGEVKYDAEYVSIYFNNSEECNPISDVENLSLNSHYVIRPSMELENPADYLIHGCLYNITLKDKKSAFKSQSLSFKIPGCVENKCQCKDFSNSPNKLTSIDLLSEDLFLISWKKTTEENITVHYIYYQRKVDKDSIRTYIPEEKLQYRNNAVEVPIHALKNNRLYTVTVLFIDEYNECMYASSLDFTVASEKHISLYVVCSIAIILSVLLLYIISLCSPKLKKKLEKYVTFLPASYESYENQDLSTPLTHFKLREEINAQYTPLEFVLKVHRYDKYEFPRNKIVIKEVIGKGAFGVVYYGEAYELNDVPEFTSVAIKQLREDAPEDELISFQAEIEILKKVGHHKNIVKLLGCVTMEKPYMMIMELVPCGCLKKYLLDLRKRWGARKSERIFFPDDMDENWLKSNNKTSTVGRINYTSCAFDNSDSSYIVPDNLQTTESSSESVFLRKPDLKRIAFSQVPHNMQQSPPSSVSSASVSSRLPSSTETEITNVDLETPTPITESNRSLEPVLDPTELQHFAFQIADGMAYLEKIPITHRDLAARNILITRNKLLKISDFGMSRKGSYVNQTLKKVPLRWMAIESIEKQTWDSKSDVWSFGVVLWEIGTLGAFPYESTDDEQILFKLKMGTRLDRPKICTDELYALMLRCWSENLEERPSFAELVELLDVKKRKIYVEFNQLSPKYVFPPTRNLDEVAVSESETETSKRE